MRPYMQMKFHLQRSGPISYEAKNSYWSWDSNQKRSCIRLPSFIIEEEGALSVFSFVNQTLEPLGPIRQKRNRTLDAQRERDGPPTQTYSSERIKRFCYKGTVVK